MTTEAPNIFQLFCRGQLTSAIEQATAQVKQNPTNEELRSLMVQLLCFQQDWERADQQLSTLVRFHPALEVQLQTWRQLIRAAHFRQNVFEGKAAPETLEAPSDNIKNSLKKLVAWREGHPLTEEETKLNQDDGPLPAWEIEGEIAHWVRDADDLLSHVLEALSPNGHYYWVDITHIQSLVFTPSEKPLDRLWRAAQLTLKSGQTHRLFIPLLYPYSQADDMAKVGGKTHWVETHGITRGQGLKVLWFNEEARPLMNIETIQLAQETSDA